MQTAVLILHIVVCLILVILVLLQAGREGMGVIFGGSGNSSVFGSGGAGGILVKLTTFLAVLFLITSLTYNIMTSTGRDKGSSVLDVRFEEVAPPIAPSLPVMPLQPSEPTSASEATVAPAGGADDFPIQSGTVEVAPAVHEQTAETPAPVNAE